MFNINNTSPNKKFCAVFCGSKSSTLNLPLNVAMLPTDLHNVAKLCNLVSDKCVHNLHRLCHGQELMCMFVFLRVVLAAINAHN